MPRVQAPQVSTQTRSSQRLGVQSVPQSRVRQQENDPRSFGVAPINPGQVGRAMSNAGQSVMRLGQVMQRQEQRRQTLEAEEALVAFEREKNRLLFDPEVGYLNTTGKQAYDGAEPFNEQIRQLEEQYAEELSDDNARAMFRRAAASHVTQVQNTVSRHSSDQFKAWEQSTMKARVDAALEGAALYWDDPDEFAIKLEEGRQSAIDLFMSQGASRAEAHRGMREFNSQFAKNAITAGATKSAVIGKDLFEKYGGMLDPNDQVVVEDRLNDQLRIEQDRENAKAAVLSATTLVDQYGDRDDARVVILEEIDKIEDPLLRDKTLSETMNRLNLHITAKNERRAASYMEAQDAKLNGQSADQWAAENPVAWDDLTPEQKQKLQVTEPPKTDYSVWEEISAMDISQLAELNVNDYNHRLSLTDQRRLKTMVDEAKQGLNPSLMSTTTRLTAVSNSMFGTPAKRNRREQEGVNNWYYLIESEIGKAARAKGSALTSAEEQDIIDTFSRQFRTGPTWTSWFGKDRDISDVLENIDPGQLQQITDQLQTKGYPVNSANIYEMYNQMKDQF